MKQNRMRLTCAPLVIGKWSSAVKLLPQDGNMMQGDRHHCYCFFVASRQNSKWIQQSGTCLAAFMGGSTIHPHHSTNKSLQRQQFREESLPFTHFICISALKIHFDCQCISQQFFFFCYCGFRKMTNVIHLVNGWCHCPGIKCSTKTWKYPAHRGDFPNSSWTKNYNTKKTMSQEPPLESNSWSTDLHHDTVSPQF